jgi:hypothetical protein
MEPIKSIGKIITRPEQRDAVHIAIAPVEAAITLKPGQHVGTDGHGRIAASQPHIGVVDPYLQAPVKAGEKCWLFLYPGSITSLRHEWVHPTLKAPTEAAKDHSERWMRAWAMEHMSEDYYGDSEGGKKSEDEAYAFAINAGHDQNIGPYGSARDHIDNEWWGHWEAITGRRGDRDSYFSCSC